MRDQRPTPEEMLKVAHEEERQEKRGHLKIFLGAAPGVGKTYAMLEEALEKSGDGQDVIAGFIETHGRQETAVFLEALEVLPRAQRDYHGKPIQEFDLDAAIKRHPDIILVDEMAHTNAPGSRHQKRWQDIQELLDLGIDVFTTLNVQHIESLNDIIAQITNVKVRETIPDSMIEMADSIELIDLPPEDLLNRLREGKVYFPEQAELASQHFFKKSNLNALRELALRMTAEYVNIEVISHRQGQAIKTTWPTSEKLLVCIGPEVESIKLIRSAKRLAGNLKADWLAIFVDSPRLKLNTQQHENTIKILRLAEKLGAETHILNGDNVVQEIINFAREKNISKIVMGKRIRPRWKEIFIRSLSNEVIRNSEEIDVCLVKEEFAKQPPTPTFAKRALTEEVDWITYLLGVLAVALATLINFLLEEFIQDQKFDSGNLIMIYLLVVIIISRRGKLLPAIFTSLLSVLALDVFFIIPRFTFGVNGLQQFITLLVMLWTSQIIAYLSVLRKQQTDAVRAEVKRTTALYNLTKQLANTRGVENLLHIAARYVEEIFDSYVLLLIPHEEGQLKVWLGNGSKDTLSAKEHSIAHWVYDLGQMAGMGTETLSEANAIYLPLRGAQKTMGVMRVQTHQAGHLLTPDQIHILEAITNQIALALEVERLNDQVL